MVYKTLKQLDNIHVFKKQDIPDDFHYKNNVRVGDILIVAKLGFSIFLDNQTLDWSLTSKILLNYYLNTCFKYSKIKRWRSWVFK